MTDDCYVSNFFRHSVDGKHLMRFGSEISVFKFLLHSVEGVLVSRICSHKGLENASKNDLQKSQKWNRWDLGSLSKVLNGVDKLLNNCDSRKTVILTLTVVSNKKKLFRKVISYWSCAFKMWSDYYVPNSVGDPVFRRYGLQYSLFCIPLPKPIDHTMFFLKSCSKRQELSEVVRAANGCSKRQKMLKNFREQSGQADDRTTQRPNEQMIERRNEQCMLPL